MPPKEAISPKGTDKESLRKLEEKDEKYREEQARIGMIKMDKTTMNQQKSSGEEAAKKRGE
jgi:hypothetical protein